MRNTQEIIDQVRDLAAHLDMENRLAAIRAIATLEPPVNTSEPELDDSGRALVAEQAAWFAQPAAVRQRYQGDYVAVYRGAVIDHDPDQRTLYLRIRAQYGRLPILVVPAHWDKTPEFTFHSTQLE